MTRLKFLLPLWLAPLYGLSAGHAEAAAPGLPPPPAARPVAAATPIQKASYQPAPAPLSPPPDAPDLAAASELSADDVVRQVLARNPSLAEMVAAWKAAQDRYPQVTSLDDPMFGATGSPRVFGSHAMDGGYRVEISQKYPWCGKLALHGDNALAEARAAGDDVEDTRLQLVESAKTAFYEYWLVGRALDVNREAQRLLGEFRRDAEDRYTKGLAPQQDIFQADVEVGQQQERQVTLERMREVAVARINTLMHLPPDSPLPPAPVHSVAVAAIPETPALREEALASRPDLKALADHLAADQAALGLAKKDYKPDVEVMAAYDDFWSERALRPQLAVRINLPTRLARRDAAVAEAQERINQRSAGLARLTDQVNLQVQEAAAQVRESDRVVRLYNDKILPAARQNIEAARAAYVTGKIPFLSLIEAERNLVTLRDRYYEAAAAYGQRLATLERVTGGEAPEPTPTVVPPRTPPAAAPGR